ncbi:hypothetical protein [Sulfurimonas marina]|uniref:Helix-turn-helix domain-containing protein n=1 Tax=Sulfurimonas marina TaxID=2590551 RepID=A0A7M1AUK1_9BACT|nr:hypothetical protein [Sulfurimonas marina]QOP41056.1 helix-turn-helix domain-containing protein [Sulfurimonas marina]
MITDNIRARQKQLDKYKSLATYLVENPTKSDEEYFTILLLDRYERGVLTKTETAKELAISEATIDRIRKTGAIKSKTVMGKIVFDIKEIAHYLADC